MEPVQPGAIIGEGTVPVLDAWPVSSLPHLQIS